MIRVVILRGGPNTYRERRSLVKAPERKQLEWHYNINNDGATTGSLSARGEVDLDGKASTDAAAVSYACTAPPLTE